MDQESAEPRVALFELNLRRAGVVVDTHPTAWGAIRYLQSLARTDPSRLDYALPMRWRTLTDRPAAPP